MRAALAARGLMTPQECTHYRQYPIAFVRRVLHVEPDEQQCRFLMAVADSDTVAAKSGHGTGKTACFAWLVLWFLSLYEDARVVVTAPTQRQLMDILWPEVRKWLDASELTQIIAWSATRVSMRGREQTWFATARTSNKPENMQGFHAKHLMILADEAPGIQQDTMEAIEGARTSEGSRIVLAGNPTKLSGTFYDAFHKMRSFYHTLSMSSEVSRNVSPDYCDRLARKYGKDSDVYRVRVLGDFPRAEPDVFITLDRVEAAVVREGVDPSGTIAIGCDPARFGDSESVIYWRQGYVVHDPVVMTGMDTTWTAGEVARLCRRIRSELKYGPKIDVMIDETGLGAGVVDMLRLQERELWINIVPVNFGGAGDEECYDTATRLLWGIREALGDMKLPDDDDTVAQLSTRKYRVMPNGKIKLESKEEMRRRRVASPDRADALGLCFYQPQNSVVISDETLEALRKRRART